MSSTLRIKVEYTDGTEEDSSSVKFIYIIDLPATLTIGRLIKILQDFIITHFGYQNMRLAYLVTDDRYLLMKGDFCAQVLSSNDKVVCVDMNQFIRENNDTMDIEEAWLKLEQHDTSDDNEKSLTVGINNAGKLYVYLFGGANMRALYLFTASELLAIARNKRQEFDRSQMKIPETSSSDWFIDVQWTYDTIANNVLFLVGRLKIADSTNIISKKIQIKLNESTKTIEKGEIINLSADSEEETTHIVVQDQVSLEKLKRTIPPPSRTGPVLDNNIPIGKIEKHECEGDSSIRMTQGKESSVQVNQRTSTTDNSCSNSVTITDIIISKKSIVLPEILMQKRSAPADKPIAISQVNVQYQWHSGKWLDCQNTKLVLVPTSQNDREKVVTSILNIEPDKLVLVNIQGTIEVEGKLTRNNNSRFRAHKNLPQPLKLKIIVIDSQSKTCSLIVEQINAPLQLVTRESFLKDKSDDVKNLIAFVYADDCEYEERIYNAVYIDKDNVLIIDGGSKSACMQKSQIRTMQLNTKKNGKTEELIEFISNSNRKATSLLDPETFLFYAIRIELTTTTSKTVETVLVPLDEIQ